jgi:hypothetical protein
MEVCLIQCCGSKSKRSLKFWPDQNTIKKRFDWGMDLDPGLLVKISKFCGKTPDKHLNEKKTYLKIFFFRTGSRTLMKVRSGTVKKSFGSNWIPIRKKPFGSTTSV